MAVVEQLPENGRVVVANPSRRIFAGVWADREGLDLFLSDVVDTKHVYILDIDAVLAPVPGPFDA